MIIFGKSAESSLEKLNKSTHNYRWILDVSFSRVMHNFNTEQVHQETKCKNFVKNMKNDRGKITCQILSPWRVQLRRTFASRPAILNRETRCLCDFSIGSLWRSTLGERFGQAGVSLNEIFIHNIVAGRCLWPNGPYATRALGVNKSHGSWPVIKLSIDSLDTEREYLREKYILKIYFVKTMNRPTLTKLTACLTSGYETNIEFVEESTKAVAHAPHFVQW